MRSGILRSDLRVAAVILATCSGCAASAAGQGRPTDAGARGRELLRAQGPSGAGDVAVAPPAGGSQPWIGGAAGQDQVLLGSTGELPVGVWLDVPDGAPGAERRPPIAISLVIDTSGSMEGQKIQNARAAAVSFLETLREGDLVSVYSFSDSVREIAPPTVIDSRWRSLLISRVQGLYASGSTAMYSAVQTGASVLARFQSGFPIRRVVLISDGKANVGPSDPGSFARLASNGTEWGAQISAIGIGLDYDEHTLGALAEHSSGRMYHLAEPAQLASILDRELNLLASTVATTACFDITPAPGVVFVAVDTPGAELANGRVRACLGSVFAGQRREVLLRARVAADAPGRRSLASVRLAYATPNGLEQLEQRVDLGYSVTTERAVSEASRDARVGEMVAQRLASVAQLEAAELLARGDSQRAATVLREADRSLSAATAAAPVGSVSRARLERRAVQVRGQAGRASSAGAGSAPARATALDAYDSAMEAQGY